MKQFSYLIVLWAVLIGYTANAQACSLVNIPANGTTTVGGVPLTILYVGDVISSGSSLEVGNTGAWQVNLFFANPVNDLNIYIFGAGSSSQTEDFKFITDTGGTLSISSNNAINSTIIGNTIIGGGTGTGSGVFKINSTTPYRGLIISGTGGSNGSFLGICSSGFLRTNDVNEKVRNNTVDISPNPAKSIMNITSKENLKGYKVFDESGKLVISSSLLKGNKQEVDISSIKTGNYIVTVETENQKINKKFIKE